MAYNSKWICEKPLIITEKFCARKHFMRLVLTPASRHGQHFVYELLCYTQKMISSFDLFSSLEIILVVILSQIYQT